MSAIAPPDSLTALWAARSIAIIGASTRPGAPGRRPLEFLRRHGYTGRVVPVNPHAAEIEGIPAVPSLAAAPGPVELAMIMVPAAKVPAALEDCAAAGVRTVIVCSSGFAETGPPGADLQHRIVKIACAAGIRLVGPNCIGTLGVANGQVASFSPMFDGAHTALVDGPLAFVSQSGALGYGAVSLAFERGLGLGWVINTGNEADVTAVEAMTALAAEPRCRAVLGYLETLSDLAGLRRLAAAGKPIAVLKSGASQAGARAAASHTGALATGDRVVDAVLRRLGIVRVSDVDELLDVGEAFLSPYRPAGRRVAVVTTSGGSGILATDALERYDLRLAGLSADTTRALAEVVPPYGSTANPVDVTAAVIADPGLLDRCVELLADDPGVDMIVACFCVLTGDDVAGIVKSLQRHAARTGKPVVVARTGADHLAPQATGDLRTAGIPGYATPRRAVRAAAALYQVTQHDDRPPVDRVRPMSSPPPPGASEAEVKALLAEAGIPVPAGWQVHGPDEAVAGVRAVGGRAVFKAVVDGLLHKTEAGGVLLDVTEEDAPAGYEAIAGLGGGVLIEEYVPDGVEVLVGVASSPLGPMLTVGLGGVLTEVLDDVALTPLPVTEAEARATLARTRAARLLAGVRGRPAADAEALVELLVRVTELVAGWPPGFELDLNPVAVLADGRGVRVLDAAYVAPRKA